MLRTKDELRTFEVKARAQLKSLCEVDSGALRCPFDVRVHVELDAVKEDDERVNRGAVEILPESPRVDGASR